MTHSPGRYLTKAIDRTANALRGLWYRHIYLSWVQFGRTITFAGPIRCAGVTGSIRIGDRVFLGPNISLAVAEGGSLVIGRDVSVNQGSILSARLSVTVGDGTRIGDHCSIRDSDHRIEAGRTLLESGFQAQAVKIGRNVWIGRQVTVLPGVTIGDDAIIGAHSLVNTDIPARALAFGTPARVQRVLA
ncbi:acyltransferase [Devosia sp.]|uniref:acyltransferase n=1 Tax=Devosia sp. TaxID=1871048 RepID=UPI0025C2FD39|nr:acyltransferase [Devosia sp.]